MDKSIWKDTVHMNSFPTLDKDIIVDVLIVGGGITGILCGYELKKRNISYVIVDKDKIGMSKSGNTTAFITAQHETLYQNLIDDFGIERAKYYLSLNLKAVEKIKELANEFHFDYQECSSILYSCDDKNIILKEKEALEKLGYKCEFVDKIPLGIDIKGGIKFNNQATINPLKLINEISRNLNIYENTNIKSIKGHMAYTNSHKISFNKVIIATHFPFVNICGFYFAKMHQRRSYVVAIKQSNVEDTYCSIDKNGMYFRGYNDYLIVGGNDRDNKQKCERHFENEVKKMFKKSIEYKWSNQDCITIDGVPYIGRYDLFHKDWYVSTGFNMWGFTWAMASSFILADLIQNNYKKEYSVVNPLRSIIRVQLFKNIGNAVKNLVKLKKPRCTHMGCALNYNELDKVWECPCHGSRYDISGNVIDGPAKKDIN